MQFTRLNLLLIVCVFSVVGSQYTSSHCRDFGCITNVKSREDKSSQAYTRQHNPFNPYSPANRRQYNEYHHEPAIPVPVPIPLYTNGYVKLPTIPKTTYRPEGYGYNHRISNRQYTQNVRQAENFPIASYSHNQRPGHEVQRPRTFGTVPYQGSATNQNPRTQQLPAPTRIQSQYVVAPSYTRKSADENYYQNSPSYSDTYFASSQRPVQSYNSWNGAIEQQPGSSAYRQAEAVKYGGWTPVAPAIDNKSNTLISKIRNDYTYGTFERSSKPAQEDTNYLSRPKRPSTNSVDYTAILERASIGSAPTSHNYRRSTEKGNINSQYFEEYDSGESFQQSNKVPVGNVTPSEEAGMYHAQVNNELSPKEQKYSVTQDTLRVGRIPETVGDRLVYPDYAKRKSLDNTKRKQPVGFSSVRERKISVDYV